MRLSLTYCVFVACVALLIGTSDSHAQSLGIFTETSDVGQVLHPGQSVYDLVNQTYRVTGSGENIWFAKDEFQFIHQTVSGDFILQARGKLVGAGEDPHRKFGWMIRTSLDTDAQMVSGAVHGDGLTSLQYRKEAGGNVEEVKSPILMPDVIQLERRGRSFYLSVAHTGKPFWTVELPDIDLPDTLQAGLFVCAHNKDVQETAIFDNVRVIYPAAPNFQPYRDYIGCHLEIMYVETGQRKVLYSTPEVIQAPNWTPDGTTLIFNKDGLIYKHIISSHENAKINTDFVQQNNNDHVLSFDGTMLGLSSSSGPSEYGSLVYTVPVNGGVPTQITQIGPSYLHGWSPDGKWLVYTGGRNQEYDIYKIPSAGGKEIQLTTAVGLDDGPEYSPDGKYIYFNSARTGTMELWRMTPDGKEQEQLTDDEYQNWFPHFSPDGKSLVFLSYMPEIAAADHPWYKHIYLRMMPAEGGTPKVIGYLYGGQGTINVPSWSPDGKYIAFVSNSAWR